MRRDVKFYQPDEETGGYRYVGKYYGFLTEGAELKRKKILWLTLSALFLLAFLGAGFLDRGETRLAYVLIPYVLCLPVGGFGFAAAVSLLGMGERMTILQYKRGARRLWRCAIASAVFSAVVLIGAVVCIATTGEFTPGFPAFSALMALVSGINLRLILSCPARELAEDGADGLEVE